VLLALLPAAAIMAAAFLLPMAGLLVESFRMFTPGRVGAAADAPLTLANYADLLNLPFVNLFAGTLRLSIIAALVGIVVAYPLAWHIVRRWSPRLRTLATGLMVTLLLLSMLVRTYAIELTFGSVSIFRPALKALGISPNSGWYIECLVAAGLLHYIIPVATLTLLGTVQNVDPRLVEAAQSLGAPAWRAHLTVTLPLSRGGLVGAFLIGLTFSLSAFVIPMILGKGRVLFPSNSIYNRFSELADYPSGAAISVVMLAVSLLLVLAVARLGAPRRLRA
jgi:putative spermidine/putrescine transport system permease protein